MDLAPVGRRQELDLVRTFLDAAADRGGALLLCGEPGIGKTMLLDAAAEAASRSGRRVLRASGVQFEGNLSFSGLNQLLVPLSDELQRLAPALRAGLSVALGFGEGLAPDRLVVSNATLALLRASATDRPLVLIVDDLQWLDRPSAVVLAFVARRLAECRVGFIATSRSEATSFFERADLPEHELGPLDDDAATRLVSSRFPTLAASVQRRVMAEARGNPLALLELPTALSGPQRAAVETLPSVLPLSRRLQGLFASRVVTLPRDTRELLLTAVLEGTGDLRVLQPAAAWQRGLEGLAPAERVGLVRIEQDSHRLVFRHPLIRSAVVELSTNDERQRCHRALANVLANEPERRAWHLAEAAVGPDAKVAALLEQAAHRTLRRGDAVGAVKALSRAADLSESGSERGRRLAQAAYIGADVNGDLRSVSPMLTDARRADPEPSGSLEVAVAAAYLLLNGEGDVDTSHRLLVGGIETQAERYDADDNTLVEALHTLLEVCVFGGRPELWPPFYRAMGRLAPADSTALYLWTKTVADPVRTAAPALERLEAAIAGLRDEVDPTHIERVATAGVYVDRVTGCREALWRLVRDAREGGAVTSAISALALLSNDDFVRGQWDEAQQLADEGIELCEVHGYRLLAWPSRYNRALLTAVRGEDEETRASTEKMIRWAAPRGARQVQAYAHHARTLAALGRGDYEYAYQQVTAISPAGSFASHVPSALWVVMDLVEAAVHTDRRSEAAAHVAATHDAGVAGLSPRLALLAGGSAAIAASDDRARALFEETLALPGADRWPFELARVQLAYGERLRRGHAMVESRKHLSAAHETFERLGAVPWSARAISELRATGQTRSRGAFERAPLTPQERQIATLAASGLTNKEIGKKLYLSHRTVGAHLYRLFPKLGVSSRAALRDALSSETAERSGEDTPGDPSAV